MTPDHPIRIIVMVGIDHTIQRPNTKSSRKFVECLGCGCGALNPTMGSESGRVQMQR